MGSVSQPGWHGVAHLLYQAGCHSVHGSGTIRPWHVSFEGLGSQDESIVESRHLLGGEVHHDGGDLHGLVPLWLTLEFYHRRGAAAPLVGHSAQDRTVKLPSLFTWASAPKVPPKTASRISTHWKRVKPSGLVKVPSTMQHTPWAVQVVLPTPRALRAAARSRMGTMPKPGISVVLVKRSAMMLICRVSVVDSGILQPVGGCCQPPRQGQWSVGRVSHPAQLSRASRVSSSRSIMPRASNSSTWASVRNGACRVCMASLWLTLEFYRVRGAVANPLGDQCRSLTFQPQVPWGAGRRPWRISWRRFSSATTWAV